MNDHDIARQARLFLQYIPENRCARACVARGTTPSGLRVLMDQDISLVMRSAEKPGGPYTARSDFAFSAMMSPPAPSLERALSSLDAIAKFYNAAGIEAQMRLAVLRDHDDDEARGILLEDVKKDRFSYRDCYSWRVDRSLKNNRLVAVQYRDLNDLDFHEFISSQMTPAELAADVMWMTTSRLTPRSRAAVVHHAEQTIRQHRAAHCQIKSSGPIQQSAPV